MASSTSEIPEVKKKLNKSGSLGCSDTYLQADKIDLTSLRIQLDKQLANTWSKVNLRAQGPKEDWEIDLANLEIRYVIAQRPNVYCGTYDGQDVADKTLSSEDGAKRAAKKTYFVANMEPIKFCEFMAFILEGFGYERLSSTLLLPRVNGFITDRLLQLLMSLLALSDFA